MPKKEDKDRKRMIVEEVAGTAPMEENKPLEEVKEEVSKKVEELQDITEDIGESVEKSAEVQEELAVATQKIEPAPMIPPSEVKPYERPSDKFNILVILIPGILLLGALLGGIFFYQTTLNKNGETPTPAPTATPPTGTPAASPSGTFDLTKYPINVENGSGIPGTAGSAKDLLTKAGFKVSSTGNAATYDFTDTIIETKSDVPQAFIDKLTTTLSGIYKVGTNKTLPSTSTDEVVVIIGSSKAQ